MNRKTGIRIGYALQVASIGLGFVVTSLPDNSNLTVMRMLAYATGLLMGAGLAIGWIKSKEPTP